MAKRKAIGKKVRFEVFKRDSFTCQYCGKTPPAVVLEIDHVEPVAAGGSNDIDNLLTACSDCNRGKGASPLSSIPETLERRAEIAREREEQRKAYERLMRAKKQRLNRAVRRVEAVFQEEFPDYCFKRQFRHSVKRFLDEMSETEVADAMEYACSRVGQYGPERTLKYFCGVCWRKIRGEAA